MSRSSIRMGLAMILGLALVLGLSSVASATSWSDIDAGTLSPYGVTSEELAGVSSGYPDGTWRPWQGITRGQFAKMTATGFAVAEAAPSNPTFSDVASDNYFYTYVESVYLAGLMQGVGGGLFDLSSAVTREQAIAVVARKAAGDEGFELNALTEAEITAALAGFADADSVSAALRAEMAYAVVQGLVKGDAFGNLAPRAQMNRIAAATVLIRAMRSEPATVLDEDDNGSSVTVQVGDLIQVVLKGNPTTGYAWTVDLSDADAVILEQVGEPGYVPDSDLIGAGGTYTFTFRALSTGQTSLKLNYARSWETEEPLKTFEVTVEVVAAQALDGTNWRLQGWSADSLDPSDFEITAVFESGRISGTAAVNLYGGSYTATEDGAFSTAELFQTLMAGPEPAMRAEALYFELLGQAVSYQVVDHVLTLSDANANELLIFAEVPATADAD